MHRARVNEFVRVNGQHWLVCLILYRCVEGERLLVCFRDGVRRTFPEGRVEAVL